MTTHKHAELIKAKADNMELVVFCKDSYDDANKWQETSQMPFQEEFDYFLCLPQHKEACLHWLNGGIVQLINDTHNDWVDCGTYGEYPEWYAEKWMMNSKNKYRIKPRKEKLYIAVKTDKHERLGGCRKVRICSHAFVNKQDAEDYLDLRDSQLIEIEVEV